MKIIISAIFIFLSHSSFAADGSICRNFRTIGLTNACYDAVDNNDQATNDTIYQCTRFRTIGLQGACLEAVEHTPDISPRDVVECKSRRTIGSQASCLRNNCPAKNFFGYCKHASIESTSREVEYAELTVQ